MARLSSIALSILVFAISGGWSGLVFNAKGDSFGWLIPLLFGLPLVFLCRRREGGPAWLWLIVSPITWLLISVGGPWVYLALHRSGIVILGILGALAFAGAFSRLIRPTRGIERALLAEAGCLGGIVFEATCQIHEEGWFGGTFDPSPVGFAVWQAAVGTVPVWMSTREE